MSTKDTNPKDAVGVRKVPISTVPLAVLSEVGLAMLEGARKYGRHNYRVSGVRASVYIDAVWRHVFQQWWDMGEDIDKDSLLNHITKGIASLVVMRDSMLMGNFIDDRPVKTQDRIKEWNETAGKLIDKYPDAKDPYTEEGRKEAESFSDAEIPMEENHYSCRECVHFRDNRFLGDCVMGLVPNPRCYSLSPTFCIHYERRK